MKMGHIAKRHDRQYVITSAGRLYTERVHLNKFDERQLPKPMTLIVARRGDEWLLFRRFIHPFKDMVGLPHANVFPGKPIVTEAERRMREVYGLSCQFRVRGVMYMTFYRDGQLEGYNVMTIVENITPVTGQLIASPQTHYGEYFWQKCPDFSSSEYIPSLSIIQTAMQHHQDLFFLDETFHM